MLLNQEQIKIHELISEPYSKTEPASVPLTINSIVTSDGEINSVSKEKKYSIPPQGMVLAVSTEILSIDGKNFLGYTTIKNSLSRQGVWALNIGLVDSNWNGPISSVLINFGKQPFELVIGDPFLRMTFHRYDPLNKAFIEEHKVDLEKRYNYDLIKYTKERKGEFRLTMDEKFLMLGALSEDLEKSIKESIFKQVATMAWMFTAASVFVALLGFFFTRLKL